MSSGATTPEELEMLLEDALIIDDRVALADLFEPAAVVIGHEHVAGLSNVLQARDTALLVSERSISVAVRRGGRWRYAVALLGGLDHPTERQGAMTDHTALQPAAVRGDEGEARWWFAALAVIKATSADTGGAMTIVEVTEPPGAEAPLHVHHREDEAFWILEGDVTLFLGDAVVKASAGDYAFGPRDIPHRYVVGPHGCRMLFICTPGGFEKLVGEMSVPAASRTLPPPSDEMPDFERVAAIARDNGCELLA